MNTLLTVKILLLVYTIKTPIVEDDVTTYTYRLLDVIVDGIAQGGNNGYSAVDLLLSLQTNYIKSAVVVK